MILTKFKKLKNIIYQIFNKKRSIIILDKILTRFYSSIRTNKTNENLDKLAIKISDFCTFYNKELWEESKVFGENLLKESKKKLKDINIPLGGGGAYELLYFLTRYIKPSIITETGVAAGYSSKAFLEGIKINKKGKLFSSDFPYFREINAEKYIGLLVEDIHKKNWDLCIEGDINFIKTLNKKLKKSSIDLFHYDSDKSYRGRKNTFNAIKKYLKKKCVIIFDDIQDNSHFLDLSTRYSKDKIKIFEFNGKYIGMIWNL